MPNILPPRVFASPRDDEVSDSAEDIFNANGAPQSSEILASNLLHGRSDEGTGWREPSSGIIQRPQHKSPVSLLGNSMVTENSPRSFPLYYSINRHNNQRHTRSSSKSGYGAGGSYAQSYRSDMSTAYAIKAARYPLLYEKLKAPAAARKALKIWKNKKDGKAAVVEETNDRLLIQDAQRAANDSPGPVDDNGTRRDGSTTENIDLQVLAQNDRHRNEAARDSSEAGKIAAASAAPSTAMVVHRARPTGDLPAQHMTFSEPILEKTRRGSRLRISCSLEQSYPNFFIECTYVYIDKSETVNLSRTDTRLSFATISTRENLWVVAMEKRGYNEAFIKGFVGEAEYDRLDKLGSEPIKGRPKSTPVTEAVTKKIRILDGFDLGGIWCAAAGFYQMDIFIPADGYRGKKQL
ncbi:hypothetical protein MFIFM68171_08201 [Madurella fahalii]|uniref:Uncharacterized protein n=1 Tax=Madurella fahalii TaxID=1157608 RepID=A0ABQ0GJU4_9PEZI